MKNILIAFSLLLATFSVYARVNIDGYLKSSPDLRGAYVGVLAVTADGDTLACHNADDLFVPASNLKLVTVASSLKCLGPEYRYVTNLALSGRIEDGVLYGDVYIIGGGDPTLAYPESPDGIFESWMKMLEYFGIRKIEGKIVGDGDSFGGMNENPHWALDDAGTYYGTGVTGLQFAGNTLNFNVKAGVCPGDSLQIRQIYPQTPWMNFKYDCTTGEKGTGDQLYLYTSEYSENAVFRGTFAAEHRPKIVKCSNKYPELTCAREFALYLSSKGLEVNGFSSGHTPEDASVIGSTLSKPLREIIVPLLRESDNFLAETLFRTLGKERFGDSGYDSSIRAEEMILDSLGLDTSDRLVISDGSGLSPMNLVSPEFLCSLLGYMLKSDSAGTYINSLPTAGVNGTVSTFLSGLPDNVRHSVHLKSGTISGVKTYSGYYLPQDGTPVIFSVMINNSGYSSDRLSRAADDIISAIVTCAD